jgi:hypothetical protein
MSDQNANFGSTTHYERQEDELLFPHVVIPRVEILGEGKSTYTAYVIELNDGAFNRNVVRRYSEFDSLNETVSEFQI